jgi:hypothetical protein
MEVSLRNFYAGSALTGLLSGTAISHKERTTEKLVSLAFELADEMVRQSRMEPMQLPPWAQLPQQTA